MLEVSDLTKHKAHALLKTDILSLADEVGVLHILLNVDQVKCGQVYVFN